MLWVHISSAWDLRVLMPYRTENLREGGILALMQNPAKMDWCTFIKV